MRWSCAVKLPVLRSTPPRPRPLVASGERCDGDKPVQLRYNQLLILGIVGECDFTLDVTVDDDGSYYWNILHNYLCIV